MRYILATAALALTAATASASTIGAYSFDVLVTPTALAADGWAGGIDFAADDPKRALFAGGSCSDAGDGTVTCDGSGLGRLDLVQARMLAGGSLASTIGVDPTSGTISFGEDGSITCSGVAAAITGCGHMGTAGPRPDPLLAETMVWYSASADAFEIGYSDGSSWIETFSSTAGHRVADATGSVTLGGSVFDVGGGYTMWFDVAILRPMVSPAIVPYPTPLPATLPLLAGAVIAVGAVSRRARRGRRAD